MKRLFPALLLLQSITACATAAESQCLQYIDCSDGMETCREQAAQLCPRGYRERRESEIGANFGAFASEHFGTTQATPHLLVTCNP